MTVTTPPAAAARLSTGAAAPAPAPSTAPLPADLLDRLAAGEPLPEGAAVALATAGCEAGLPGVLLAALTDPATSAVARERAAVRVLAVLAT